MNAFWIVHCIAWALVLVIAAKGAFVAAWRPAGKVRRGDPMRLATFLVATLFVGQSLRWLIVPNDVSIWKGLYILGVITALYVIRLMASYGRGERV